jgi:hypothetical protein
MRMYRLWRLSAAALLLSRTVSAATLTGRVTDPDGRPYARVDTQILSRNFDLLARVLNVSDRYYEEALGFSASRRSAIVGVRVAAGR